MKHNPHVFVEQTELVDNLILVAEGVEQEGDLEWWSVSEALADVLKTAGEQVIECWFSRWWGVPAGAASPEERLKVIGVAV